MLSERISTWRLLGQAGKNWQARQTASISKQLMWKPFSAFGPMAEGWFAFAQRPNLCWRRMSWQLSCCVPTPWPRPSSSIVGSSRGSGLSHRPDSPWYAGVRDAMRCVEPVVSTSVEGGACGAGPAVTLAMLRPWGPAFSETLWVGERCRSWRWPRVSEWPERVLALSPLSCELSPELYPGTILVGWETVRFWRNWPWAPGALSGWGWGFCVKVVPPLTGPEWASRRGSWECGFPSVSEGKEPRPCTS